MVRFNIMKKGRKKLLFILFAIIIIAAIFFISFKIPINKEIPGELFSKWKGISEVFADFKLGKFPSDYSEDLINIEITINHDYSVSGNIGDAKFHSGEIQRNRSDLGKVVGIFSDYIISDGILEGRINEKDTDIIRKLSIPLNFKDGKLTGSINIKQFLKHPDPLFPRLELTKNN